MQRQNAVKITQTERGHRGSTAKQRTPTPALTRPASDRMAAAAGVSPLMLLLMWKSRVVSSCDVIDDVSGAHRLPPRLIVATVAAASRRKHEFLHERPTEMARMTVRLLTLFC